VAREAVDAADEIAPDELDPKEDQERVVVWLLPIASPEGALEGGKRLQNEKLRAQVLIDLAPRMPPDLVGTGLDIARPIRDPVSRQKALSSLFPHISDARREQILDEMLAATCAIEDAEDRRIALESVVSLLVSGAPRSSLPRWQTALHFLASRKRQDLLNDLRALAPLTRTLGTRNTVEGAFRAIETVGRWWP
jgi:hypothetical protein